MSEKILSISVAAYNVEQFLEKTLSSLICDEQTLDALDIIIVNDGSKDGTSCVAERYVQQYPGSFRLIEKENGGYGSTLNTSVSLAEGVYFKMLDGDDWYDGDELIRLVELLRTATEDIILSPYCRVYEGTQTVEVIERHGMKEGDTYFIERGWEKWLEEVHAAEMTVRTELLKNRPFQITERCAFTDDEYVFAAILNGKTYKKVPYVVYQYRIGVEGQTVSAEGRRKYWLDAGRVVCSMLRKLQPVKERGVEQNHILYLYWFIRRTAEFQCNNFAYGENMKTAKCEFERFSWEIRNLDMDFLIYLKEHSDVYCWWEWVFEICSSCKKEYYSVFGAGRYGERIYRCLRDNGIEVLCFCDNNEASWGQECFDRKICPPESLLEEYADAKVIVAVKNHADEIAEQLRSMGVDEDRIIAFGK